MGGGGVKGEGSGTVRNDRADDWLDQDGFRQILNIWVGSKKRFIVQKSIENYFLKTSKMYIVHTMISIRNSQKLTLYTRYFPESVNCSKNVLQIMQKCNIISFNKINPCKLKGHYHEKNRGVASMGVCNMS